MKREFEILIVDDEMDLALNLHNIVEMEGFKASVAYDGKSALKKIRKREFGLALVDIKLPDLSGIELVEKMAKLSSETDYIIITGNASLGTAIEAVKQNSILSYEIKPVDIDRLLILIKQVADRKQAEAAFKESEQRYRELFENMSGGVAVYEAVDDGKDFVFKDFNKAGEKIERVKREDVIGKRVTKAFPGVKKFGLFEVFQRVWRTGKAEYFPAAIYEDGLESGSWRENWVYKLPTGEIVAVYNEITERKRAEEELKRSEERFRSTLDNMLEGCQIIGYDWKYLYVNDVVAKHGRRTKEELLGHTMMKVYPGIEEMEFFALLKDSMEKRTSHIMENEFVFPDGIKGWFELSVQPIPEGIFVLSMDITERKRAEVAIMESEERFSTIFKKSPIPASLSNMNDSKLNDVNDAWCKLMAFSREEAIGHTVEDLKIIDHETRAKIRKEYLSKGFIKNVEVTITTKSGEKREILNSIERFSIGGEEFALSLILDITERKRAEVAIMESGERYRMLFNSVNDAIMVRELSGKKGWSNFIEANDIACQKYGYKKEEFHLLRPKDIRASDFPENDEIIDRLLKNEKIVFETMHKTKKGEVFPVEVSSHLFHYKGKPTIISIVHDITERKKAEDALRKSETFLNSIIEFSPYAMWISDDKGTLIRINQACRDLIKVTDEEVIGKYNVLEDNIVEEAGHIPLVKSVFNKGKTVKFRIAYESSNLEQLDLKKSSDIILDTTISPIKDVNGKITNAIIQHIDMTDRVRAEEALKISEDEYRTLVDNTREGILVFQDDVIKFSNPKIIEVSGYTEEELVSTSFDKFIHPEDLDKVLSRYMREISGEDCLEPNLYRIFRKDGRIRWVEGTGISITWEGRPASLTFLSDVTEKKKAEEALKESEERYRNLVENLNDAIFNLDSEGNVSYISPVIEAISDYKVEELIGRPFTDLVHPDDLPGLKKSYDKTMMGEYESYEFRALKKDGTYINISTSSRLILKDNKMVGMSGVLTDITEKKRMQEQLIQTEKLSSLGGIISGVAHELNNPLAAIIGNTQLLMRKEVPKEIKDKLETIKKESIRSSKIVGGLLSFAREHKFERKMIDINSVIRESYKLREYELRMDNIQFELDLSEKIPNTSADPYQLQQVFVNLLNNSHDALKAKKGGRINIKSYERDDKILVEIEDNGPGISKESIRKIFDPFFTTKEVGEGTGLGLSIVYGIIKKHGGTIYVDSNVDKSTKFTIELPVIKDFAKEEKVEIKRPKKPEGVKSVLVVEDEVSLRDYVSEALLLGGYTVETCGGGEEAIKLLRKNSAYDAIVSDMKMPGLSGQNLYTFVHKEYPRLVDKMLFITGDILGKETQNFLRVTGAKFVEKPFTIDELLSKLSDILDE